MIRGDHPRRLHLLAHRVAVVILAAGCATAPPAPPVPEAPAELNAESILDAFVRALGGADAFAAIQTTVSRGRMEIVGTGIGGEVTTFQARPAKQLVVFEAAGLGAIRSGSDGEVAWEVSDMQGARVLEGAEKAFTIRSSMIDAPARWRELYESVELTGEAMVDERPCHTVVLTPAEGNPETWFVEQESDLVVKMTMTMQHPMGEIPVEVTVADYRQVGGILVPHRLTQKVMIQEMLTVLESVELNVDIDPERFELPDEIKALIAKAEKS